MPLSPEQAQSAQMPGTWALYETSPVDGHDWFRGTAEERTTPLRDAAQASDDSFHELRFTGAKLTDQSDDASSWQGAAELARDSLRLNWTNGSERSHGEIFDFRFSIFD